jgi:hypothetical protein
MPRQQRGPNNGRPLCVGSGGIRRCAAAADECGAARRMYDDCVDSSQTLPPLERARRPARSAQARRPVRRPASLRWVAGAGTVVVRQPPTSAALRAGWTTTARTPPKPCPRSCGTRAGHLPPDSNEGRPMAGPRALVAGGNWLGATIGLRAPRDPHTKPPFCTPFCTPPGCKACTPLVNIRMTLGPTSWPLARFGDWLQDRRWPDGTLDHGFDIVAARMADFAAIQFPASG